MLVLWHGLKVYLCFGYTSTSLNNKLKHRAFLLFKLVTLPVLVFHFNYETLLTITLILHSRSIIVKIQKLLKKSLTMYSQTLLMVGCILIESVTKIKYYVKDIEPSDNYTKDYVCWVKTVNAPKPTRIRKETG